MPSCIGPFTLQDISQQKLKYGDSSQSFIVKNNQILVPAKINGEKDTLFFDTGLMSTVVKFSDSESASGKTFTKKTITPFGQATCRYNKYITDIQNTIWDFDNYLGIELFVDLPECTTFPLKLIGFNAIASNSEAPYFLLNFEQKELSFKNLANGIPPQYTEIKSSFTKKGLFIYLNVNGTTMPFLLPGMAQL